MGSFWSSTDILTIERFEDLPFNNRNIYNSELELRRTHLWSMDNSEFEQYEESDKRCIHFIITVNNDVIGTVQYDPELNRLRQLVVHPSHRGLKIGSRLVQRVKQEAKQDGLSKLKVHSLQPSIPFYTKFEFVSIADPYESHGVLCQKMQCKV
eukprot:75424_1